MQSRPSCSLSAVPDSSSQLLVPNSLDIPPKTVLETDIIKDVRDEDKVLVCNVLRALDSLGTEESPLCRKYKVNILNTCYMVHAKLPTVDPFEITLDDLLFVQSVNPTRIENIAISRTYPQNNANVVELLIKILDCRQHIMIKSSVSFHQYSTENKSHGESSETRVTRKRRMHFIP
jgi:hypothetical protein